MSSLFFIIAFFYIVGNHNPFAVKPSFHLWAPWIGQNTRKSVSVLNTEWEKVHSSNPNSASEIPVTEERLTDELMTEGEVLPCLPSCNSTIFIVVIFF